MGRNPGFPRASWLNLLASSPMSVLGMGSSSTAVDYARSALLASNTTGSGILSVGGMLFDGTNFQLPRGGVDGTSAAGAVQTLPVGFTFKNITTAATTTVKNSPGLVHTVTVNTKGVTSSLVLKDGTTVIATIDTTLGESLLLDVFCATSIVAVTAGGTPADVTIFFR